MTNPSGKRYFLVFYTIEESEYSGKGIAVIITEGKFPSLQEVLNKIEKESELASIINIQEISQSDYKDWLGK